MLAKLLSTLSRRGFYEVPAEQQPAEIPAEMMRFEPMVPLLPPEPHNDAGMSQVYEEVEKALRASGHLQ